MAFLRNRTINLVNLHYGIQALAMGMGGVFFLVILLRAGLSASVVLCTMALILIGRFALRPLVLVFAKRWGLKPALVFGTVVLSAQYPMLAAVHGIGAQLVVLILIASLGDTFYWSTYHAYFASLGDSEHRGHQVSAREALAAVVGIVAPLIGAWAIVTVGPGIAFACVGFIQALAALPLLGTPNVSVLPSAPGAFRAALPGIFLFIADGWFAATFVFVWQMALFLSLRESFQAYGGAMALAALVGAASGLLLGRHIDAGHGRRAATIAYVIAALILAARAASLGTPWLAIGANALGSLASCLMVPAMMTTVYNLAKASPCALRFHIATEGGWDAGCATCCLIAAALAAYGTHLSILLALGFPGLAVSTILLRRYYAASGAPIEPVPLPLVPPGINSL
jgi:MFS transporter, DHA1 family, inner membrane transport protein